MQVLLCICIASKNLIQLCKTQFMFLGMLFTLAVNAQEDTSLTATFDFDDHRIAEKDGKITPVGVGISLTNDRFGNERCAVYIHGHLNSYLNLGTSPLLKPRCGTVSLWVNHGKEVLAGKGYESNPIIVTKNSSSDDFYDSYDLFYDHTSERFMVFASKDSTEQAGASSIGKVEFNRWYHLVFTYDDHHIAFYVDGDLQLHSKKNFVTVFNPLDSVIVGHSANKKNERYMRGSVDDIRFFHRVLSQQEILDLYKAPNPNKTKNLLYEILMYVSIILVLVVVIVLLVIRNRYNLKKQKEQFELINKISELELKVVKAQINPHFISNCLAAIQELIFDDVDKAVQYIARFSFFLRQVLNYSDRNYISLADELEIVKLNVELEQLRFKDEFFFDIHVDDSIDTEQPIPALICQPFVENAIWHGLLPLNKRRAARLTVNVVNKSGSVHIEIEDNGVGRTEEGRLDGTSKGTRLVMDKIETLNRLSKTRNHELHIIDMRDEFDKPAGTKVVIIIHTQNEWNRLQP